MISHPLFGYCELSSCSHSNLPFNFLCSLHAVSSDFTKVAEAKFSVISLSLSYGIKELMEPFPFKFMRK